MRRGPSDKDGPYAVVVTSLAESRGRIVRGEAEGYSGQYGLIPET